MIIQNAALELASFGIRVNGIAPGLVETNFRLNEFDEPKIIKLKQIKKI